jgi:hypothetical protein
MTRPPIRFVVAALVLAAATGVDAAGARSAPPVLRPLDEADRQGDFFTFRARLQVAVAARDSSAVLADVHPAIKNSFGGNDGIDEFRRSWNLSDAASPFWVELAAVLALGGTFSDDSTFVAPYVFSRWPDDSDAFEHVAILGRGVRARAAPTLDALPLTSLDFAIVPLAREAPGSPADPDWTAIRLADGRAAWVASRLTRSPIAYRAIFSRRDGRWQLVTFIAGD